MRDFREAFAKMADEAVVTRAELAELLATTQGALSQMRYRGELPEVAFPGKRRTCWFAGDVRQWLGQQISRDVRSSHVALSGVSAAQGPSRGRPRKSTVLPYTSVREGDV